MLFMVIERFADNDMAPVYRRLRERGRQLPEGLDYVDSWVERDRSRCLQLMRCADPRLLDEWMQAWAGTGVTFEEVVPVMPSTEARARVEGEL